MTKSGFNQLLLLALNALSCFGQKRLAGNVIKLNVKNWFQAPLVLKVTFIFAVANERFCGFGHYQYLCSKKQLSSLKLLEKRHLCVSVFVLSDLRDDPMGETKM